MRGEWCHTWNPAASQGSGAGRPSCLSQSGMVLGSLYRPHPRCQKYPSHVTCLLPVIRVQATNRWHLRDLQLREGHLPGQVQCWPENADRQWAARGVLLQAEGGPALASRLQLCFWLEVAHRCGSSGPVCPLARPASSAPRTTPPSGLRVLHLGPAEQRALEARAGR